MTPLHADDKDNGGDGVYCIENGEKVLYSLDYLVSANSYEYYEPISWEDSHKRILKKFGTMSKYLKTHFGDFVRYSENYTDRRKKRFWDRADFGLASLNDEDAARKLPPNCGRTEGDDGVKIVQLIRRRDTGTQITYDRDKDEYEKIKQDPLQYSFLKVHEWLWEVVGNPWEIYRINALLHSKDFDSMSKEDFSKIFYNITGGGSIDVPLEEGVYHGKGNGIQCREIIVRYSNNVVARVYGKKCKSHEYVGKYTELGCYTNKATFEEECTFFGGNGGVTHLNNDDVTFFNRKSFKAKDAEYYTDGTVYQYITSRYTKFSELPEKQKLQKAPPLPERKPKRKP